MGGGGCGLSDDRGNHQVPTAITAAATVATLAHQDTEFHRYVERRPGNGLSVTDSSLPAGGLVTKGYLFGRTPHYTRSPSGIRYRLDMESRK